MSGATSIPSMPFNAEVDITLATQDLDVCVIEGQPLQRTPGGVWFAYTPAEERVFRGRASIAGRGDDARVSVFTGACGSLTQVGCNPDGFPGEDTIVLNAGVNRPPREIESEVIQLVRDTIGPVAAFKRVTVVKRLPKTRSGKILRGTMRQIADGQPWKTPATIDDPAILEEIKEALEARQPQPQAS